MLPDIEARARKLVQLYADLESRVRSVVATHVSRPVVTHRDQMRAYHSLRVLTDEARPRRMAHATGLVRLAYVRGGRGVRADFRMAEPDLLDLADITTTFTRGLQAAENAVLFRAHASFRFKGLGQQAAVVAGGAESGTMARFFESKATVNAEFALEQYVHAAAIYVSEQAITHGELAATRR